MNKIKELQDHSDAMYSIATENNITLLTLFMQSGAQVLESTAHGVTIDLMELILNWIASLEPEAQVCLYVAIGQMLNPEEGEPQALQ